MLTFKLRGIAESKAMLLEFQAPSCSFPAGQCCTSSMVSILTVTLTSVPKVSGSTKMSREIKSYAHLGAYGPKYWCRTASFDYFIRKKKSTSSMVFNNLASHWQLCKQAGCVGLCSECWSTSLWPRAGKQTDRSQLWQANWGTDRVAQGPAALNTCSKHLQTYSSSFKLFLKF